jgi:hypothetical protein
LQLAGQRSGFRVFVHGSDLWLVDKVISGAEPHAVDQNGNLVYVVNVGAAASWLSLG